jgi:lysozyme
VSFTTAQINALSAEGVSSDVIRRATIRLSPVVTPASLYTERVFLELMAHEAIVLEAYRDSEGIWTWGVGVTNASGHQVHPRYLDKPQTVQRVLEVFIWLCRERYGPAVLAAFKGRSLTEAQFAAALSFHYNTGAIGKADWVESWLAGNVDAARREFMNWRKPASIIPRREKERDLFFDGKWTSDGKTNIYPVRKPSYAPAWGLVQRVDIRAALAGAMA